MALIENKTTREDSKHQTLPAITIRESLELSTKRIEVTEWAEHLHCEILLETPKKSMIVRLGHDDVLDIYNQTKKILKM